jgi:DNA-binding NarL/FixJ family response regulator
METAIVLDARTAAAAVAAALERIPAPAFVVNGEGRVGYANRDGRALRLAEAQLRAATAQPGPRGWSNLSLGGSWYLVVAAAAANDDAEERLARARARLRLSARRGEVLALLVGGATNKTIAELLGIAVRTVEVHLTAIYERAGVENRASLVSFVLRS